MSGALLVWLSSIVGATSAFFLGFVVAGVRRAATRPGASAAVPSSVAPSPTPVPAELPTPVPTGERDLLGRIAELEKELEETRRLQRNVAAELDEQLGRAEKAEAELRRLQVGAHRPSVPPGAQVSMLRDELEVERRRREAAVQSQLATEHELQMAWRELELLRERLEGGEGELEDDLEEKTVVAEATNTLQAELDRARAEAEALRADARRTVIAEREAASMRAERDDLTKRLEVVRTELERVRQQLAASRQRSSDLNRQLREARSGARDRGAEPARTAIAPLGREGDGHDADASGHESEKPTPPARLVTEADDVGEALVALERAAGFEVAVLSDRQGLRIVAHGDGGYTDELAAFAGIAGGVAEDAEEILPVSNITRLVCYDAESKVVSLRFFDVESVRYVLSTLCHDEPPGRTLEETSVGALERLLRG